jgi:gliding motility-associated-like protein
LNPGDYVYTFYWEHKGEFFFDQQNLNSLPLGDFQLWIQRQDHRFCEGDTFYFSIQNCRYRHRMYSAYISPNGDGINDYLNIFNIEHYPNNTVTIINSYGETIFRARNYDNNHVVWDGRNRNGHLVPDGVYYYIVEAEGFEVMAGWLMMKISTAD